MMVAAFVSRYQSYQDLFTNCSHNGILLSTTAIAILGAIIYYFSPEFITTISKYQNPKRTKLSSSPTPTSTFEDINNQTTTFPFLNLPLELRLQVYHHALPTNQTIMLNNTAIPPSASFTSSSSAFFPSARLFPPALRGLYAFTAHASNNLNLTRNSSTTTTTAAANFLAQQREQQQRELAFTTPLFHTSRQVRREARREFFAQAGDNAFVLCIDDPKAFNRLPNLLSLLRPASSPVSSTNNGAANRVGDDATNRAGHDTSADEDTFTLIKDLRIRVGRHILIDLCGPKTRRARYNGGSGGGGGSGDKLKTNNRVILAAGMPEDEVSPFLQKHANLVDAVEKVLETVDADSGKGLCLDIVERVLSEVFVGGMVRKEKGLR